MALLAASGFGRLGQYQLRGVGLHHLPKCQGSWWPAMDFAQGFQIWRELGMLQDGSHISFAGLTAIHYVHRLMAYVVLAAMVWLALQLRPYLKAQAHWLLALAALQLATGLSNVILDWPLLAAVLHTGGCRIGGGIDLGLGGQPHQRRPERDFCQRAHRE